MSAFDYSKWDHIELSDDEDDVHPNIDKESWFRMRHRSRIEREENESKDIQNIKTDMSKAKQRMEILQYELQKLDVKQAQKQKTKNKDEEDSDDDDVDEDDLLDDKEALEAELKQLQEENEKRQLKLDEYEKNKKWNIDNMFQVKEERTVVSASAATTTFNTESGYVVEDNETSKKKPAAATAVTTTNTTTKDTPPSKPAATATTTTTTSTAAKKAPPPPPAAAAAAAAASKPKATAHATTTTAPATTTTTTIAAVGPTQDVGVMETYHEFTTKYADVVEQFMKCTTLAESEQFLLQHASILLQENASNYLLLASLEDEMNGLREKMKLTTRQSQLITNIAELAKTVKTHPGNVIKPFFARLSERKHLEDFLSGVKAFQEKIIQRAIVKKQEIDSQRAEAEAEEAASEEPEAQEPQDLHDIPREERLGPGGLDPLEVIETLPQSLVEAFESRNVDELKNALLQLPPDEAEYHMKRCVDSGLWVAGNGGNDE